MLAGLDESGAEEKSREILAQLLAHSLIRYY